jgi:hypothetical protein
MYKKSAIGLFMGMKRWFRSFLEWFTDSGGPQQFQRTNEHPIEILERKQHMPANDQFNEDELKLIQAAKQTMKILEKIIKDMDPNEVIKDKDLAELIVEKTLPEALADPVLGKQIRERVTPDLTQLNVAQEALVIGQLGATIFSKLMEKND